MFVLALSLTVPEPLGAATAIVVSPASVTLAPGATYQFTATSSGQSVNPKWRASGGSITQNGRFTAGPTPGSYRVTASMPGGSRGSADVVITSSRTLTQLVVAPADVSVQQGSSQPFTATGVWSDGTTSVVGASWTATGGTITSTGTFTAGQTPGTYQVVATQTGGTLRGSATVNVTAVAVRTLLAVAVSPTTASVQTSAVQQFTATGRWSDGTTGPLAVAWSATGGVIGSTGLYTAGSTAGSYEVTALSGTLVGRAAVTIVQPPTPTPTPTATFSVPGGRRRRRRRSGRS